MLAEQLTRKGWPVWALCLTTAAVEELTAAGVAVAAQLDVTDWAAVKAMAQRCERECPNGIQALVNNAGIGMSAMHEWIPLEPMIRMVNINLVAVMVVSQAFMPLLRRGRGRLVNVASILGRIGVPSLGAYCATKYGVEGFSDAIRQEMRPFGVRVCIIEPGFMRTPIVDGSFDRFVELYRQAPQAVREAYGDDFIMDRREKIIKTTVTEAGDPQTVVDAMIHATTSDHPRARYPVGRDMRLARVVGLFPASISDFLQGIDAPKRLPAGAIPSRL